ncbi:MAG: hypothetical protein KQJ78_02215 [Deltaproteobacteria bacterium]|nr:hypothetical protein [Deltaproteobacteria bacterium]
MEIFRRPADAVRARTAWTLLFGFGLLGVLWAGCLAWPAPAAALETITRLSQSTYGVPQEDGTEVSSARNWLSEDGRYAVFASGSSNLVEGDTNGVQDVFLHDRATGQVTRVSVASDGSQADGESYAPAISGDGSYIVFLSRAGNLSPLANGQAQVYAHERVSRVTTLVSLVDGGGAAAGGECNEAFLSREGRYVVFSSTAANLTADSDTNGFLDVFRHDRQTAATVLVSWNSAGTGTGNSASWFPSVSPDGRYVAFESLATDLVAGGTAALRIHVYLRDLSAGEARLLDQAPDGAQGDHDARDPRLGPNGRYVVFHSMAGNLDPRTQASTNNLFLYDRLAPSLRLLSLTQGGVAADNHCEYPALDQGRYLAFESRAANLTAEGSNGIRQAYRLDLWTGEFRLLSKRPDGAMGQNAGDNTALPLDGRMVGFLGEDPALVNDPSLAAKEAYAWLSGPGGSYPDDGLVSRSDAGVLGDDVSSWSSSTTFGRWVAFYTRAENLTPLDGSGHLDVFVRDRATGQTVCATLNAAGTATGNHDSWTPMVSWDGRQVVFSSEATDLVAPATVNEQVFLRDLETGAASVVSQSTGGVTGNGYSRYPRFSGNGRQVVFNSLADNLVAGDLNGRNDVFARDLQNNTTTLVSLAFNGAQGNDNSLWPDVSGDGRYVVFRSAATNLVPGGTTNQQIFRRDTVNDTTELVSCTAGGVAADADCDRPHISADGNLVVFESSAGNLAADGNNGFADAYAKNLTTGEVILVSRAADGGAGNGDSVKPAISADGASVVFASDASNLTSDDNPGYRDVFVRCLATGRTIMLTRSHLGFLGAGLPAISPDGRTVTFNVDSDSNLDPNATGHQQVYAALVGPGAPVGQGPNGVWADSLTPTLAWLEPAGDQPDTYYLSIWGDDGLWREQAYPAAAYCSGGVCTVHPSFAFRYGQTYLWSVRADYAAGQGRWSTALSFTPTITTAIAASPSPVTLSAPYQGGPASTGLTVSNAGGGSYAYTIASDQAWLTVSPDGGTCAGSPVGHTLTVDPVGMAPGVYTANLTISGPAASNSPQTVPVSVTVDAGACPGLLRAYHPGLYDHFYTISASEMNRALTCGYQAECAPAPFYVQAAQSVANRAVLRLYCPYSGQHYYTLSGSERDVLVGLGWRYEGVEGYVFPTQAPGTREVYKLYNTIEGCHLYTLKLREMQWILANLPGWQQHSSLGFAFAP